MSRDAETDMMGGGKRVRGMAESSSRPVCVCVCVCVAFSVGDGDSWCRSGGGVRWKWVCGVWMLACESV
jgi:hypothetical protein